MGTCGTTQKAGERYLEIGFSFALGDSQAYATGRAQLGSCCQCHHHGHWLSVPLEHALKIQNATQRCLTFPSLDNRPCLPQRHSCWETTPKLEGLQFGNKKYTGGRGENDVELISEEGENAAGSPSQVVALSVLRRHIPGCISACRRVALPCRIYFSSMRSDFLLFLNGHVNEEGALTI